MTDSTFHYLDIAIQVIGLLVVIFGGGKYIGSTNQMLKQLFINDGEQKKAMEQHVKEDHDAFKEMNDNLKKVEIAMAAKGQH